MRIRIRHFTWEDIEPIARLHRASEAVDHAGRICDAIALLQRWRRPGVVPEECLVAERAGAILGYVHRSHVRGTDQCQIDGVVHPAWRRRGIGRQLLERVAEEARLAGAKALDVRAREDEPGTAAFCQATGFRLARVWYRMWLEPVRVATYLFPPGYSRRTFRPHHDEAAYASVLNEAFSEHWGMGPTTPERVAEMVGEPGFEPADVLLATWQREVVGLCHMRFLERQVHGRSLAVAHIGPVAVLTGHRGRGLGHALVAACLHQCRRKHMQAAELDVDEGNRPAIHVYEDCGFETLFRILWYRRDLDGEDCG